MHVSAAARLTSPPRARLAFRVGIVGHRPNRLPRDKERLDRIRWTLRTVLEEVQQAVSAFGNLPEAKELYVGVPPILRAISPLAEGSDRMFAEEAIELGYELVCPMPFSQEEFENDFLPSRALEPGSFEHFRELIDKAGRRGGITKFELDGERSDSSRAYSVAGRVVLNQSDLLIAVWDGGSSAGEGGTVETLQEAVAYHVPVLWIDSEAPQSWQLLLDPEDFARLEAGERPPPPGTHADDLVHARSAIARATTQVVNDEIALRDPASGPRRPPTTRSQPSRYFLERKPSFNPWLWWALFRNLVGSTRLRIPCLCVPEFEAQISSDWPRREDVEGSPRSTTAARASESRGRVSEVEDWINSHLRPHYAWSDKCGELYGDAYRSAYVLTYLLSATAVVLAQLPMVCDWGKVGQIACGVLEFLVLLIVLLLLVVGRARRWHENWLEYRLLAELIRQLRLLAPLGGGRPLPRIPSHLGLYENLTHTWMYWHMRAIARATGIPRAKVTREYVLEYLDDVAKIVGSPTGGQLAFHRSTETRSRHIAHRLHAGTAALFVLTLGCICIHLLLVFHGSEQLPQWLHFQILETHHEEISRWLLLGATSMPAFAAALAGISNQGEFARLAKRSAAMADAFADFAKQLTELCSLEHQRRDRPKLPDVVPLANKIAEVMADEVTDWRIVFIDRPQTAA